MQNAYSLLNQSAFTGTVQGSDTLFASLAPAYWLTRPLSFGLVDTWRSECINRLKLEPGMQVADIMCGGGQTWAGVLNQIGREGKLVAVDNCPAMLRMARQQADDFPGYRIETICADALESPLSSASFDAVVCSFGVKTLTGAELETFVLEARRILKMGGQLAVVEISEPENLLTRKITGTYLKKVVPALGGWLYPRSKDAFRKLAHYQGQFGSCGYLASLLCRAGFRVEEFSLSGGLATGVVATFE